MTGVHCPGNNEVYEPKPDMTVMPEALRVNIEPLLMGEELLDTAAEPTDREADEECSLDGNGGVARDFINGVNTCLADCSALNFFKILVSNRNPS